MPWIGNNIDVKYDFSHCCHLYRFYVTVQYNDNGLPKSFPHRKPSCLLSEISDYKIRIPQLIVAVCRPRYTERLLCLILCISGNFSDFLYVTYYCLIHVCLLWCGKINKYFSQNNDLPHWNVVLKCHNHFELDHRKRWEAEQCSFVTSLRKWQVNDHTLKVFARPFLDNRQFDKGSKELDRLTSNFPSVLEEVNRTQSRGFSR